jgi:hypothetical protein
MTRVKSRDRFGLGLFIAVAINRANACFSSVFTIVLGVLLRLG